VSRAEAGVLAAMIRRGVNTPRTSGVGRLFDAVAVLALGVHEVTYEGEAAVWLEAVADADECGWYDLPAGEAERDGVSRGDWRPLLSTLLADLARGEAVGRVAARFHNGLARWAAAVVARQPHADVLLTGGCFQNRLLAERTADAVREVGRRPHLHGEVPPGDGGLAAGQLAVALARRRSR
jgi:hydrogenase maturation protein HypF